MTAPDSHLRMAGFVLMANPLPPDLRIEIHEKYLEAQLRGRFSIARFKEQMEASLAACKAREISLLLFDFTQIEGSVTTMDRFEMGAHGARVALHLKIACYSRPDLIDPQRFGVMVARNRGLKVEVFADRSEAVAWLLQADP